jgi:hypothetical protein
MNLIAQVPSPTLLVSSKTTHVRLWNFQAGLLYHPTRRPKRRSLFPSAFTCLENSNNKKNIYVKLNFSNFFDRELKNLEEERDFSMHRFNFMETCSFSRSFSLICIRTRFRASTHCFYASTMHSYRTGTWLHALLTSHKNSRVIDREIKSYTKY